MPAPGAARGRKIDGGLAAVVVTLERRGGRRMPGGKRGLAGNPARLTHQLGDDAQRPMAALRHHHAVRDVGVRLPHHLERGDGQHGCQQPEHHPHHHPGERETAQAIAALHGATQSATWAGGTAIPGEASGEMRTGPASTMRTPGAQTG
ncbi:hypothetical protein D3C85_1262020 [compost metagenome]